LYFYISDPIVETSTSMGAVLNICNDIAPDYSASKWRTFSVGREWNLLFARILNWLTYREIAHAHSWLYFGYGPPSGGTTCFSGPKAHNKGNFRFNDIL